MISKNTIGVVGNGFVGGAIVNGFTTYRDLFIYDKNIKKRVNTLEETLDAQYVFVCLPTPMTLAEGGEADLSIMYDFFSTISYRKDQVFIIKSTVPVGTTEKISRLYGLPNIVHYPEFLTARTANSAFICSTRNILGGVDGQNKYTSQVRELLEDRFPSTPIYEVHSNESELIKYSANCFFATKIMFFNELHLLANKIDNIEWENIISGMMSDGRIAQSHMQVPGHDGEYGFGGVCFPKDINALISTMENHGINPLILKSVWEQNKKVRGDWDWSNNESSVSERKKTNDSKI